MNDEIDLLCLEKVSTFTWKHSQICQIKHRFTEALWRQNKDFNYKNQEKTKYVFLAAKMLKIIREIIKYRKFVKK